MADQNDWKSEAFRRKVITQIEDALRNSNTQMNKSSGEMENHVFQKAKSRDEYLALVARLILHVKDYNSQRRDKQLPQGILGGPMQQQQMGTAPGMQGPMGAIQDPINALQSMAMSGPGMGQQPQGHGVIADDTIEHNQLLCYYNGELISNKEGEKRMNDNSEKGSFLFFFNHNKEKLCIDGTKSSGCGRMINDDHREPNCKVQLQVVDGVPKLAFTAIKKIEPGTELRFNYGDKSVHWRKFLHQTAAVQVVWRNGEGPKFPLKNHYCLIGRSCDIIVSKAEVLPVQIQIEVARGEVFLTNYDNSNQEKRLQCGDEFSILDRSFKIVSYNINDLKAVPFTNEVIVGGVSSDEEVDSDFVPTQKENLQFEEIEVDSDFVPTQKENLQFEEKIEISKEADDEAEVENIQDNTSSSDDNTENDDDVGDPDYCETSSDTSEDDIDTEKKSDTDFSDVVSPVSEMSEIIAPSCEEIERPLFPQLIVVDKVERSFKGSLSNKKHCCTYCEKLYPNIARHLSLKHKNEIGVGKILALPKQSKERRKMWDELVKKGDFAYNFDILTSGKGTIIPKYRARDAETTVKNVLPCQYCRGMYRRKELWRHQKACKSKESSTGYETRPIAGGKKMLPVTCSNQDFHENIILNIKEDEVKLAILSDPTIIDFGLNMYNDQGHQKHKHVYISQKMRELGRLQITGKKNNLMSIEDCMKKENWDLLILSVKEVSEFNPETKNFGIPSLALKLGHSLKICAEEIYFKALKVGDTVKQEVAKTFLEMYKLRWNKEISGKALTTLDTIKYNRPKFLPLVEDVAKLNNYINEKCKCALSESQTSDVYREFCQLCLAQIIVFNRKRSGEAERMTVSQFKTAKVGGIIDPVIMSTLTEFEQTLCRSYLRVEIVGKKGRKVPVLLTNGMQKNLNMLVTLRSQQNIPDDFMFARPGNARFPFRGVDCLRSIINQAGLKFPEIITSTSLRKQLATMAQVLNLNDTSQDLLAAFEGHDIRVHRAFYRLPEETMQVAKVSRLLHCLNNGTIGKYSGCNFDDIEFEIDADVETEDVETEDIETEDVEAEDVEAEDVEAADVEAADVDDDHTVHGKKRKENPLTDGVHHVHHKKAKISDKHVWTFSEKTAIEQQFAKNIKLEKVPGKLDVLNVQRKCSVLCALPWKKIKFAVYNQIKSKKNRINKMHNDNA